MKFLSEFYHSPSALAPHLSWGEFVSKIAFALFLWFVIYKAINKLSFWLKLRLAKTSLDSGLQSFTTKSAGILGQVILALSILELMGVNTSSFLAVLGAAGLAVGLALRDTLNNLAGGVFLVVLRPFKIGDDIEFASITGTVQEIHFFYTILLTPDRRIVHIPNGNVASGTIINLSTEAMRRVDLVFDISYKDDLLLVKKLLTEIAQNDSRTLQEPAPRIIVQNLAESSVQMGYRVFVPTEEYWNVYFDTLEKVKLTFDEHGITIPFPQQDIHLTSELTNQKLQQR